MEDIEQTTATTTTTEAPAAKIIATPAEIEEMKRRVKEMEEEASRLRDMQTKLETDQRAELAEEIDSRSVFVNNVDYSATPEELQAHFQSCGSINRVTIICDKFSGTPKGHAYIEFTDPSCIANAMVLNESLFKGRLLQVTAKRTNIPSFRRGRGGGRGSRGGSARGFRARGRGRGGRRGGYSPY